jgi:hypothetical protein
MEMTFTQLGLNGQDALFIDSIVELFFMEGLQEITFNIRKHIKDIHTGHLLYAACVYGSLTADRAQRQRNTIISLN